MIYDELPPKDGDEIQFSTLNSQRVDFTEVYPTDHWDNCVISTYYGSETHLRFPGWNSLGKSFRCWFLAMDYLFSAFLTVSDFLSSPILPLWSKTEREHPRKWPRCADQPLDLAYLPLFSGKPQRTNRRDHHWLHAAVWLKLPKWMKCDFRRCVRDNGNMEGSGIMEG
jgi:hypothetical protein